MEYIVGYVTVISLQSVVLLDPIVGLELWVEIVAQTLKHVNAETQNAAFY